MSIVEGKAIRDAREALGWTQRELANAVGVSRDTIINWEKGYTVSKNKTGKLRTVLAATGPDALSDPLRAASDADLLTELLRRAIDRGNA